MRISILLLFMLVSATLSSQAFSITDPTITGLSASVAAAPGSDTDVVTDMSLLGGELDLVVTNSNGGSFLTYLEGTVDSEFGTTGSILLEWDGIDGDATTTSFSTIIADLGSCGDFTINFSNSSLGDQMIDVTIEMYNDQNTFIALTETVTLMGQGMTAYTANTSLFQSTGTTFNFNSVTAIRILIDIDSNSFDINSVAWVPDVSPTAACAPIPDPNACQVTAVADDPICDDNGTPLDPTDDTFTFTSTPQGSMAGVTWTATDGSTGTFGVEVTFGPFNIADGDASITITADDDSACNTVLMVSPPATCSDDCLVTATADDPICDDNGTLLDINDDTFTFMATVTGIQAGTTWTASDGTTGTFGVEATFGPFNIADGDVSITVTADDDTACNDVIDVVAPMQCSIDPAAIPTMGQWGIMILGLCFLTIGLVTIRSRKPASVLNT